MPSPARELKQIAVIEDWLPEQVSNGTVSHAYWPVRRKVLLAAKLRAWAAAQQAGWTPVLTRARLTVVLVFPVHRRRDVDNLHARCKGLIDGLKRWIVDDSADWLELVVRAEVRPRVRRTELTLEALG